MANVPWSGGPPTQAELENWLVTTRGLERSEAREIAGAYARAGGGWSEDGLENWVDDMLAGLAPEGENFSAVAQQAERMIAERDRQDEARGARNQALAAQRSDVIAGQYETALDAGPAFDSNALSTSVALGFTTDAAGNITDESVPVDATTIWNEIKGLSFNMGSLALPGPKRGDPGYKPRKGFTGLVAEGVRDGGGQRIAHRSADAVAAGAGREPSRVSRGGPARREAPPRRHITPSKALALLGQMPEDYLIKLQREMLDAGFYDAIGEGERPSWGVADAVTRQAFITMFSEAAQRDPNKSISRILDEMTAERIQRLGPPESGPGSAGQQQLLEIEDFTPEVTSAETLSALIDDQAQDLFGEFVSEDKKQGLIKLLQQRETDVQRTVWERGVANARQQAGAQFALGGIGAGGGGQAPSGAEGIDRFMSAISGQESGGDYDITNPDSGAYGRFQIMPANWAPWATRAGLGPNAPRTAQNQEIVARRIMLDYYNQFGNWRDVAIAWYGGPGAVGSSRLNASQGKYPTINEYADQILDRMGQITQGDPMAQSGIVEVGGEQHAPIETFDPASEAEAILKASDPAGWEAHEFGDRAVEFYSLLQGVV